MHLHSLCAVVVLQAVIQKLESDLGKVDYRSEQYRQKVSMLHDNVGKLEQALEQQRRQLEVSMYVCKGCGQGVRGVVRG